MSIAKNAVRSAHRPRHVGGSPPLRRPATLAGLRSGDTCLNPAFECMLPVRDWPQLARTGVLVALADLRAWRTRLDQAWTLLDPAQRQRAQRQRRPSDRDHLVLSYALHRLVLGCVLDQAPADVPLLRDTLGCPRIDGGALHTSLSHAGDAAAIAVTARGPVGVDLEPASRARELPEIAHSLCHPKETAQLATLPASQRAAWLLALWVRKEAFLKAEGVGLEREMSSFVAADRAAITSLTVPGTSVEVRTLDADPGQVLAVAMPPGSAAHLVRPVPAG
jgi:4'-phosphopantetheinyl transferase